MKTTLTENSSVQDRLNVAFAQMRKQGMLARQRFLCCGSCACCALADLLEQPKNQKKIGAVFYHKQDARNLDRGQDFYLGFGANEALYKDEPETEAALAQDVAQKAVACLTAAGLTVEWDGSHHTRILVKQERTSRW